MTSILRVRSKASRINGNAIRANLFLKDEMLGSYRFYNTESLYDSCTSE